jgi:hypothetical protein
MARCPCRSGCKGPSERRKISGMVRGISSDDGRREPKILGLSRYVGSAHFLVARRVARRHETDLNTCRIAGPPTLAGPPPPPPCRPAPARESRRSVKPGAHAFRGPLEPTGGQDVSLDEAIMIEDLAPDLIASPTDGPRVR